MYTSFRFDSGSHHANTEERTAETERDLVFTSAGGILHCPKGPAVCGERLYGPGKVTDAAEVRQPAQRSLRHDRYTYVTAVLTAPLRPTARERSVHDRLAMGATTITGAALALTMGGWSPSPAAATIIVVLAVCIGMPHGAYDVVAGPRLFSPTRFFLGYGLLVGAVVVGWLLAPAVALAAFLAASWAHFGAGDVHGRGFAPRQALSHAVASGGVVLGLPLLAHADVVEPVFNGLLLGRSTVDAAALQLVGLAIATVAAAALVVAIADHLRVRALPAVVELVLVAALAATAHPLISFAVYFACWHSPRHLVAIGADRRGLVPTLLATVVTLVAGGAVMVTVAPAVQTVTTVVFIGLAALTLPHLLVTSAAHRHPSR
jgi:beta-carotene 15,15'-dioxygenase